MTMVPEICLSSSHQHTIPAIGMGTMASPAGDGGRTRAAILDAIKAGYRHFDTALIYGSEPALGDAVAEALRLGLVKSRSDLFITSKLPCGLAERELVVPAIQMSLRNLQMEYLDLYMIHWPLRLSQKAQQTPVPKEYVFPMDVKSVWEGMEQCQIMGLTRSIGVSNFSPKRLDHLISFAKIPPSVNQVEMNPLWQQKKLREYCKEKGIHVTAYSPLGASGTKWGDNRVVECELLEQIAKAKGKTTAQIALRWVYEQGVSLVAKSFNKERMRENLQIFDWSLTEEESYRISQLPQRKGVCFASILGPHDLVLEIDAEL